MQYVCYEGHFFWQGQGLTHTAQECLLQYLKWCKLRSCKFCLVIILDMQVRNVPQDVLRTMQHLQLFQEDCPYQRDLRVRGHLFTLTKCSFVPGSCVADTNRRTFWVHLRSCGKTWDTSKACHTSLPCFFCTPPVYSFTIYSLIHLNSYSDSPFDAFVAFSNVIIRPFFQNYFKRREVSY